MAFPCSPNGPLSWTIGMSDAFENLRVSNEGPFPVVVFSHGNQSNSIDYVYTLEGVASHGFIVAAPDHFNNTRDDVRIDFVNAKAKQNLIPCYDGLTRFPNHVGSASKTALTS